MKYLFIGGPHDGQRREVQDFPPPTITLQQTKPVSLHDLSALEESPNIEIDSYSRMVIAIKQSDFVFYHHEKMHQEDAIALLIQNYHRPRCAHDTDNDGNCHRCFNRGGCLNIGGPFL